MFTKVQAIADINADIETMNDIINSQKKVLERLKTLRKSLGNNPKADTIDEAMSYHGYVLRLEDALDSM